MFDATETNPISPAMRALLDVFATELAEVRFPDVDTEVLEEGAKRVREQADAVAQALAALEAARQALADSQDALLQKGQRALAYARVFSEEDAELSARLEGISLPKRGARPEPSVAAPEAGVPNDENSPRRRGRPPKSRPSAPLFSSEGAAEAASSEPVAAAVTARSVAA